MTSTPWPRFPAHRLFRLLSLACLLLGGCRQRLAGGTGEADGHDVDWLLASWNAAVDATPGLQRDLHWREIDQFPHPTFRQGDEAAYTGFADILLVFYGTEANLAY